MPVCPLLMLWTAPPPASRMTANGTKETFSDDSQNDCFGVLSGS